MLISPYCKETAQDFVASQTAEQAYNMLLASSDAWIFRDEKIGTNSQSGFDRLRVFFASKLDIDPANIGMVGSAKIGFSLAPHKDFSPFTERSDIDLVIVSADLFKKHWDALLEIASNKHLRGYEFYAKSIFRGFVTIRKETPDHHYLDEWRKFAGPIGRDFELEFGLTNEITYRVYRSWEDVRRYHVDGINKLQNRMGGQ